MEREKRSPEKPKPKAATSMLGSWLPCSLNELLCRKFAMLCIVSFVVAVLLTPSFIVDRPYYRLGDIADRNIKAKRDLIVEDEEALARKRDEAVKQSPIVFELDENLEENTTEQISAAFQLMRGHMAEESQASKPAVNVLESNAREPAASLLNPTLRANRQELFQKKADFERLLGIKVAGEVFSDLIERQFSVEIQQKVVSLLKYFLDQGVVSTKAWLLQPNLLNLVVRKTNTGEENLVPPPFAYPDLEEARKLLAVQAVKLGTDVQEIMVISQLGSQLLHANLNFNLDETERRRERAYASVKPIFLKVTKAEMIVREGQRIGPEELQKIRAQDQTRPGQHWSLVFITIFLFSALCIWVVVHVSRHHLPSFRLEARELMLLGLILIFLLGIGRSTMWIAEFIGDAPGHVSGATLYYAIPFSVGGMIACIFFGVTVSLIFSLLVTLFAGMLFGKDFGLFLFFLIGSFVAAHGVSPCRNRMTPIKAGILVGLVNILIIILGSFLQDQLILFRTLTNAFFGFCGGLFAGILVTGFTPLLEMIFGLNTDIRLLELATMDQPLLQELIVQAPGTYHHSIIVGNMAETAAKSIGANSLLAKVAAYYHDIGKTKKPLYFIENQFSCENRHEKLAPSMSNLILVAHVKDGVEMAKQARLGQDIIDIISQHHGKSMSSFFYKKAIEAREKAISTKGADLPPIEQDDFRYPGPKPQTKEAGLVMLADIVEAACRSLTDPTPARIQGTVHRLINNVFSDGQLDECELTLKDLHQIAKHFNQILTTIHHKRIEYPTGAPGGESKVKTDGQQDTNQREPKPDRDKAPGGPERGKADLKRLGIH